MVLFILIDLTRTTSAARLVFGGIEVLPNGHFVFLKFLPGPAHHI